MNRRRAALGLLLLAGCARTADKAAAPIPAGDPTIAIPALLHASAEAWNRGDLEGFLRDYRDAATTTYVGAAGIIRGLDEIRHRYRAGYWGTGRPEHRLRFDHIVVRPLGPDHALTVGRYILSEPDTGRIAGSGIFSLVFARTQRGWKIIHDHSSASSP